MAKPGNKEGATAEPIPLMVPRGGDYLDNYDNPPVLVVPTVKQDPSVEPESGEKTAEIPQPTSFGSNEHLIETENIHPDSEQSFAQEQEEEEQVKPPKKKKKKAASKKTSTASSKKRPKRADIGFRADLEEATSKLRKHVIAQADEDYVTRTDIVAQATCAVARAMDSINCGQIGSRGHYRSVTAAAYDAALQEAFYKGVALHFLENNVHNLPDRLLQTCHDHYRQRNGLTDD